MATLYLLCGLPGSGKTTLARQLERERNALVLSEDVWMARLYPEAHGHDDAKRERLKAVQWEIAARALRIGVDVVLDWGFWGRAERDDFRARAAALGACAELHYLDVPRDELIARLTARNANLPPDSFPVTIAELDAWRCWFQPPEDDELVTR
jgi:predicted kinase